MKSLLFFGEIPPKIIHGISISNSRILNILSESFFVKVVEDKSSFSNVFELLLSTFISYLKIIRKTLGGVDVYYVNAPMSRLGLIRILISIYLVFLFSPRVKVISHLHRGDFLPFISNKFNFLLFSFYSKSLSNIVVLSERASKELLNSKVIDGVKIKVLHNTIIHEHSIINKSFNYPYEERKFYCLSNYIETKRIHSLVSVANQLSLNINFNGTIYDLKYMKRLKELDISDLCSFSGITNGDEKVDKLAKSKALVLPSLNEGMPLVLLESLALGTPVICYNIGYISDYLGIDYPGLVNEYTDEALKSKLEWFEALEAEAYEELRLISFNLFWDNFGPEKIRKDTLKIFNEL